MPAIRIIDDHLELANIGTNTHAQIDTHIAAADNYVKRDGSLALTSDWDIGDTRKIHADEIRARDAAGLKLYDDGDNGIFVEDGGHVGLGTTTPAYNVDIYESVAGNVMVRVHNPNTGVGAYSGFRSRSDTAEMLQYAHGSGRTATMYGVVRGGYNEFLALHGNGLLIGTGLSNKPIIFGTDDVERMRILGTGNNIGMGIIDPAHKLDIYEDIDSRVMVRVQNPNAGVDAYCGFRSKSDTAEMLQYAHSSGRTLSVYGVVRGGYNELYTLSGNGLIIGTGVLNTPIIFGTQSIERMRILGTGNIGMGIIDPAYSLDIYKDDNSNAMVRTQNPNAGASAYCGFRSKSDTAEMLQYAHGSGRTATIYGVVRGGYNEFYTGAGNGLIIGTGGLNAPIIFGTQNLERMRILGSGEVGIATTTPTAKLDVNSDIIRLRTAKTPASSGAAGNQGDRCWDVDYFYICTATNTWERTPHAWDINAYTNAEKTKLGGIETGADVTDATNVGDAGAVMRVQRWIVYGDITANMPLGTIPANSFIRRMYIHVTELFNDSGPDTIEIGISSDPNKFGLVTDVSSTGIKVPADGVGVGYNATEQAVTARYMGTSLDPTQGKALVIVEYVEVTAQP